MKNSDVVDVPLTQGQVARISSSRGHLRCLVWHAEWSPGTGTFYAKRAIVKDGRRTSLRLHQAVMETVLGRPLRRGEHVDHVNHDTLDCTDGNLRLATVGQNQMNARPRSDNSSGRRGVSWRRDRRKWAAQIKAHGKQKYLGSFVSLDDAAAAYDAAAAELHREFATLNHKEATT